MVSQRFCCPCTLPTHPKVERTPESPSLRLRKEQLLCNSIVVRGRRFMVNWRSPFEFLSQIKNEFCHFFRLLLRTEADTELHRSEARFRALVAATSDYIYEMSPDWHVMYRLEGRRLKSRRLLGDVVIPDRSWFDRYIPQEDKPFVWAAIEHSIRAKSYYELEHRAMRFDGSTGWILSRAVPIFDEQGQIVKWFGVAIDITERKAAGEALLRHERLASLGRMAATISHEINNPLEALTNLLFLAAHTEGIPSQAREYLEEADAELGRIAHITRQALGFYRESASPGEVSVDSLLNSSVDLVKRKIAGKHIALEKQFRIHPKIVAMGENCARSFPIS